MKKFILFFLIIYIFLLSCSKKDDNDNKLITLKGQFPTIKNANISSIDSATRVLVFNLNNEYTISEIINGSFSIQINRENPVGLIFTNEKKEFLGYLSLHNGIKSIPLNYVNDSVSTIDFGTLKDSLNVVTPLTNYYYEKFDMDEEIKEAYIQASINFTIIIQNPDADQNGVIDILENKFYKISYLYFATGGTIKQQKIYPYSSITPTEYRLLFTTNESSTPDNIEFKTESFTFYSEQKKLLESGNTIYFSNLINTSIKGNCEIKYGNKILKFDLPNPFETLNKSVFVIPYLTFKDNNLIKVNWEYYSGNNTSTPLKNSENIIFKVMVQIDDLNYNRLYDSPNYNPYVKEDILNNPINYSNIGTIYIGYYDIFGNNMVISYKNSDNNSQ